MAIDVSSSYEPFVSPRISFSHDLNNQSSEISTTIIPSADNATFDFCITPNFVEPIRSADELFFGGILLPTQIKKPETLNPKPKLILLENEVMDGHRKRLKDLLSDNDEKEEKHPSRSFWKFTRTTSLNSDNGGRPKRLFRSLSLKRMLRTNSTDSTLISSASEGIKVIEKSSPQKPLTMLPRCSNSIKTSLVARRVTEKNSGGRYDGGMKINPVLNIPPTFNVNLFGFGSLFCKSKQRKKNNK